MRTFVLCLLVIALPVVAAAQQKKSPTTRTSPELLQRLPSALTQHTEALGDRVLVAGKEKTVLVGQLQDEKGKASPIRLTLQLPGLVLLETLTPDKPAISTNEAMLETLTADTPEGMLTSVKDGAAVHLLGRRVKPDPSKRGQPDPLYDIFEVTGVVPSSATGAIRLKRYFFDSDTGLLARTQYIDDSLSPPLSIESRFSDWRRVDRSAYPGRMERLENGQVVFLMTFQTIAASPKQDPASFR